MSYRRSYSDKDFLAANEEYKNNVIETVCEYTSHNFINKDALIEIIRYQNKKTKELEGRYTCQEDLKEWIIRNWSTIEECISNQINKSVDKSFNPDDDVERDNLAESIASEIKDGIINVIDTYEV